MQVLVPRRAQTAVGRESRIVRGRSEVHRFLEQPKTGTSIAARADASDRQQKFIIAFLLRLRLHSLLRFFPHCAGKSRSSTSSGQGKGSCCLRPMPPPSASRNA